MAQTAPHQDLEDYDRRDADTIWRIGWKGPHAGTVALYVVIVFEFLSRPDHWAAVRLMAYVALVYQRLIDNQVVGPEDQLPPVIPIVLYNADPAWDAPEELDKLIVDLPGLEGYRPRFRYRAIDVKRYRLADLERMPNRAAALFQLEQEPLKSCQPILKRSIFSTLGTATIRASH